jgi:hypothetical protein
VDMSKYCSSVSKLLGFGVASRSEQFSNVKDGGWGSSNGDMGVRYDVTE